MNAIKFGETLTDKADGNPELNFKVLKPFWKCRDFTVAT